MKVLALSNLYPPDHVGGYELACAQVVDALRARGHEVEVLTSAPRSRPVPRVAHVRRDLRFSDTWSPYHFHRIHHVTQRALDAESRFVNAGNVHALLRTLEDFRPDVVYLNHLLGVGGLGLLGCLQHLQVPWVWQLGDLVPAYLCSFWDEILPPLAREFSRQVRGHYLVVSQKMREEIERRGVALNGTVEVLPNWIAFEPPPRRSRYFRPGDRLKVVSAGRIDREKGIDLLIRAAALLNDAGRDNFKVDIFGRVADLEFPNLVHQLGVGDRVTFRGALPQPGLIEEFQRSDLFAFPTHENEPFGLAPLEAAAVGCVPLLAQHCGVGEWLVKDVHCLKAPRTAEGFASAIGRVLDGSVDLEAIGRRAEATVRRDFRLDAILPSIERALTQAASEPRPAPPGMADDVMRMALLWEKLTEILLQEPRVA